MNARSRRTLTASARGKRTSGSRFSGSRSFAPAARNKSRTESMPLAANALGFAQRRQRAAAGSCRQQRATGRPGGLAGAGGAPHHQGPGRPRVGLWARGGARGGGGGGAPPRGGGGNGEE